MKKKNGGRKARWTVPLKYSINTSVSAPLPAIKENFHQGLSKLFIKNVPLYRVSETNTFISKDPEWWEEPTNMSSKRGLEC